MDIQTKLSFSSLTSENYLFSTYNILGSYGLHDSKDLETEVRNIIKIRENPDITFAELFEKTGKDLVIVSCCLNREKPVYFHHATFGNVKLIDALMASISVPIFFIPRQLDLFGTKDYFVDGGIVDNYPLWIFNNIDALYKNELNSVDKDDVNCLTLGLKLYSSEEKNNFNIYEGRKPINSVFNIFTQLLNTLMIQNERSNISSSYIAQTIPISSGNIYFLDFDITKDKIATLINNGHNCVNKYFDI